MPEGFESLLEKCWKEEFDLNYETSIFKSIYESMVLRAVDEYIEFLELQKEEDETKEEDGQRNPDGDLQTNVSGE